MSEDSKRSLLARLEAALDPEEETPGKGEVREFVYEKPQPGKKSAVRMRNQKGDAECKLCNLTGDPLDPADFRNEAKFYEAAHAESYKVWSEWNPREKSALWTERVVRVCAEMGLEISSKEVAKHFRDHRIEQPAMPGTIRNEDFLRQAGALRERALGIIQSVYRQRHLTSRQLATVFFGRGRNWAAAKKAAQTDCNPLAQAHFLYKYFPSPEDQERVEKFLDSLHLSPEDLARDPLNHFALTNLWYIGKRSIPYLTSYYDLSFQPSFINYAEAVRNETLIHDIRANEIFVACAKEINQHDGVIPSKLGDLSLGYNTYNWYGPGPRLINMGFVDPINKSFIKIKPDGFAALSVEDPSGEVPSGLLPFWIEYDRGSKDTIDVAMQIYHYHLLALSRTPGKRFPELQIENYTPPMIMVFASEEKMRLIHKRFLDIAREKGITSGAPIWFALERDWFKNPFGQDICMDAWDEDLSPLSFLDGLLRFSGKLLQEGSLSPDSVLEIDASAAPAKGDGAASTSGREEGRETYAEQREARALEDKKQAFFEKYLGGKRPGELEDVLGRQDDIGTEGSASVDLTDDVPVEEAITEEEAAEEVLAEEAPAEEAPAEEATEEAPAEEATEEAPAEEVAAEEVAAEELGEDLEEDVSMERGSGAGDEVDGLEGLGDPLMEEGTWDEDDSSPKDAVSEGAGPSFAEVAKGYREKMESSQGKDSSSETSFSPESLGEAVETPSVEELMEEPAQNLAPEPAQEFAPEPAQEFAPEPAQEFAPEPVQEFTAESIQEPVADIRTPEVAATPKTEPLAQSPSEVVDLAKQLREELRATSQNIFTPPADQNPLTEGPVSQTAPQQVAPQQPAPPQVAPQQPVTPQAAPQQPAPPQVAPQETAPPQAAPQQSAPQEAVLQQHVVPQAAPHQPTQQQPVPQESVQPQPAPQEPAPQQTEQPATQQAAPPTEQPPAQGAGSYQPDTDYQDSTVTTGRPRPAPGNDFPDFESSHPGESVAEHFQSTPVPEPDYTPPEVPPEEAAEESGPAPLPEHFPDIENEISEGDFEYKRPRASIKPPKPIGDKLDTSLPKDLPPPPVREEMSEESSMPDMGTGELPPEEDVNPADRRRARRKRG